jgi:hypothetical protein
LDDCDAREEKEQEEEEERRRRKKKKKKEEELNTRNGLPLTLPTPLLPISTPSIHHQFTRVRACVRRRRRRKKKS